MDYYLNYKQLAEKYTCSKLMLPLTEGDNYSLQVSV